MTPPQRSKAYNWDTTMMTKLLANNQELTTSESIEGWVIKDGRSIFDPSGSRGIVVDAAGKPDAPLVLSSSFLGRCKEFVLTNVDRANIVSSFPAAPRSR